MKIRISLKNIVIYYKHIQMHGETDTFNLFINPINQNFEYYLQKWHIRKQQCFSKQTSFQEKIQILIP